jgi:hypothetical protein
MSPFWNAFPEAGSAVAPRLTGGGEVNGFERRYRMVTGVVLSGCVGTDATPRMPGTLVEVAILL